MDCPSKMNIVLPDDIVKYIFDTYRNYYLNKELLFRFTQGQCFLLGKIPFNNHRSVIKIHGVKRWKPQCNAEGVFKNQKVEISFTLYYLNQLNNEILEYSSFKLPFVSYLNEDDKLWSTEYCCKHLINTCPESMKKVMIHYMGFNNGILLSKYNCYYAYNLDSLFPIYEEEENYLPQFMVTAKSSMNVYSFEVENYVVDGRYEFDKLFKALLTNWSFLTIYDTTKGWSL